MRIKSEHKFIFIVLILIQILITTTITINAKLPVSNYIEESLHYTEVLKGHFMLTENFLNMIEFWEKTKYAPIYYLLSTIFIISFGKSIFGILFVNNIFFALTIISTYLLAEKLFDKKTAIYSSIILFFIPGYFILTRELALENGLSSMIPLTLYLFLKSENFKNKKFSILTGISFGIGMLIKFSFLFYIMPILIIYFMLNKKDKRVWSNKNNIILFFLIAISFMLLWYSPNLDQIGGHITINYEELGEQGSLPNILSKESLIFYPKAISFNFLGFILTLLLIMSMMILLKKYKKKSYIILAIITPIILLLIIPNKQIRYLLPLVSFFTIIIGLGIKESSNKKANKFLVIGIFFVLIMQSIFLYESFNQKNEKLYFENMFLELDNLTNTYVVISETFFDAYLIDLYSLMYEKDKRFIEPCFLFEEISPNTEEKFSIENIEVILISKQNKIPEKTELFEHIGLVCSRYPYKNNFDKIYNILNNNFKYNKTIILNAKTESYLYKYT